MLKLLFSLIFVFSVFTKASTECVQHIGSCEYYSCLEQSQNCGEEGYYQHFGLHYCKKYQAKADRYKDEGKIFLQNIRFCLQEKLEQLEALPMCGSIKNVAIKTHEDCYRENNFCDLGLADQFRIKWMAKREFFDKDFGQFAQFLNELCYPNSSPPSEK
ncbi:MAG: hypothetical protein ABL930_13645 [Pseudobdellovibrio sp.]